MRTPLASRFTSSCPNLPAESGGAGTPARPGFRTAILGLGWWLGAGASAVFGCDLCRVYNVPLAHGNFDPGFHAGVSEQFTHFGTIQEESRRVRNEARQWMDSSVAQFLVGYQISDPVGVQLTIPWVHRSFRRAEDGAIETGEETGLGDMAASLSCLVLRQDKENDSFYWRMSGGLKFPTGDTRRLKEELNETAPPPGAPESAIHGHDLALGSGSFDPFVGTDVLYRHDRWFFTAGVNYSIRTRGDYRYRFANDLQWAGGPGCYLLYEEELTLGLQAEVTGETKGKDELGGEKAEDTAVTSVFLGPRLSLSWRSRLGAELGVQIPMDIQNSALQSVPDWRVLGSLVWKF